MLPCGTWPLMAQPVFLKRVGNEVVARRRDGGLGGRLRGDEQHIDWRWSAIIDAIEKARSAKGGHSSGHYAERVLNNGATDYKVRGAPGGTRTPGLDATWVATSVATKSGSAPDA